MSHKDSSILVRLMNEELSRVQSWIHANKLSLNIDKTNYMLFSNSLNRLPNYVMMNGVHSSQVESTKFLGLYIDNDLSWKTHVNHLCKLLSRNTGIINKLKLFLTTKVLLTIYTSLISPYLNYGILAWGNCNKVLLDKLLIIQKRAMRFIHHVGYFSHTKELFCKSKILKVSDLYLCWYIYVLSVDTRIT